MKRFCHPLWVWALALSCGLSQAALACDAAAEKVESPDKRIAVEFCLQNAKPVYAVTVEGRELIAPSALGLELKDLASMAEELEIEDVRRRSYDQTWEQVWGEERFIREHYNELKVTLSRSTPEKYFLTLVFRVFNDGIGFRYELPEQRHLLSTVILDEKTEFRFADDYPAWWIPAYDDNHYEHIYKKDTISQLPRPVHTPLTLETGDLHVSLHEANLGDFTTYVLRSKGAGRLGVELVPWADGTKVKGALPLRSSWRTVQIGRTAGDLVTSYLILNLNEPNRLKDTSWIQPMKFLGIWWGMHIDTMTWSTGPKHGATTERAKQYIDFAAQLKIPGLLIEGWNYGWDGDWFQNGEIFNFTQCQPDFNLEEVARYAREKGVDLVGHHETSGGISNYERQVDDAFALYRQNGVRAVKTGYVNSRMDGRGEWHYGQFMARHHQLITEKAAKAGIMLDIHEPIKDTGLRRTYPNVMTREGARGAEYDAWGGVNGNPPEHATVIPFTRSLSGPFDYTPGVFDLLKGKTAQDRVRTTVAKQLALYVVIYSPLHMAADLPENYVSHPAFQFIQDVPTDWHTTNVIHSKIGDYTTFARRDRHSQDWYVGSVTDENPRDFDLPLSFLDSEKVYCAEIYRDTTASHYLDKPLAYEIVKQTVRATDALQMHLGAGGGQAIRFVADRACP